MSLTMERTGSVLGDDEEVCARDEVLTSRHTPVRQVSDPDLRNVLDEFDAAFTPPMAALCLLRPDTEFTATPAATRWTGVGSVGFASPYVALKAGIAWAQRIVVVVHAERPDEAGDDDPVGRLDAVETIESLRRASGLPLRDICLAAGVSRSAFYTWTKPGGPRPRVASVMRLWGLVQLFEDLSGLVEGPYRDWLLSDEQRYSLFLCGEFDELVASIRRSRQIVDDAPAYTRLGDVGADRLLPDDQPVATRATSRRAVPARPAVPGRRRR